MPFIKPGEVYEVQKLITELIEDFPALEKEYRGGNLDKDVYSFLERNAVTGNKEEGMIVKVNGVWVDVDSFMDAPQRARPIDTLELE